VAPVEVFEIDDDLARFLGGPVAIVVATRNADRRPRVVRGYAAGVSGDGTRLSVHVPAAQCRDVLEAIEETGVVAAVFSRVRDYTTYQIKGIDARIGPTVRGDSGSLAAYCDGFFDELERIGIPRESTRGLAFRQFVQLTFTPTAAFAQTPGPGAGRELGKSS
jgi:hypothetical protein